MRRIGLISAACLLAVVLASTSDGGARSSTAAAVGGELAFSRGKLFVSGHIWSADPSGALTQLTRGRLEVDPSWSPDGRRLAFVGYSRTPAGAAARTDLYVVDRATGKQRRVTNDAAFETSPSWSPDGERLVYTADGLRGGGRDLMIIKVAGGKPRRLLQTTRFEAEPRWAPKGERILFLSGVGDLYLIRSDGMGERRILRQVYGATWSPDGATIALTREGLYLARPDGTNVRRLSALAGLDPAWSSDGRTLAFTGDARDVCGDVESRPVIVLVPVRPPGPPRARACTKVDEFDPAWRPAA